MSMHDQSVASLLERIDAVDSHIKVFSESLPRIKSGRGDLTQAHLSVVEDCLPFLKRLICYISETVPVMERMAQVVSQGVSHLGKVSQNLGEIDQTAERAVTEILDVLEMVREELVRAAGAQDCGNKARQHIETSMTYLLSMMDALQFQDITSQRVRATVSLLAELDQSLGNLVDDDNGEVTPVQATSAAQQGSFDAEATFDREKAEVRQDEIDDIMAQLSKDAAR